MPSKTYIEGKLWGEDRDPSLSWEGIRGLENERLGGLLRSLGRVAGDYRESERQAHCPPFLLTPRLEVDEEAYNKQFNKFHDHMDRLDRDIGKIISEIISFSDIDPNRIAMYSKTAIFKEKQPVLYWEHWGTDDLDDIERDSIEFQMFVGLNDHLQTEAGKNLAKNVLNMVLEDSLISLSEVPSGICTFGTVSPDIFIPFVKSTTVE